MLKNNGLQRKKPSSRPSLFGLYCFPLVTDCAGTYCYSEERLALIECYRRVTIVECEFSCGADVVVQVGWYDTHAQR